MDIPARKLCLAALSKMLARSELQGDLRRLAIEGLGVRCCLRGLCNGSIDIRDGGALSLLTEAAATLCALYAAFGGAMAAAAQEYVHREERDEYAAEWTELLAAAIALDSKRTKSAYKALLRRKQARTPRVKGSSA